MAKESAGKKRVESAMRGCVHTTMRDSHKEMEDWSWVHDKIIHARWRFIHKGHWGKSRSHSGRIGWLISVGLTDASDGVLYDSVIFVIIANHPDGCHR